MFTVFNLLLLLLHGLHLEMINLCSRLKRFLVIYNRHSDLDQHYPNIQLCFQNTHLDNALNNIKTYKSNEIKFKNLSIHQHQVALIGPNK